MLKSITRKLGGLILGVVLLGGALASTAAARPHFRVYFGYGPTYYSAYPYYYSAYPYYYSRRPYAYYYPRTYYWTWHRHHWRHHHDWD